MFERSKPILIFDGDCQFCRRWILRWQGVTGDRVEYAPWQEVVALFPEISQKTFETAVQLVEPDGRRYEGAEAIFRALSHAPGRQWPLGFYRTVPGVAWAAEWVYRFVARHRGGLSTLTRWLWGRHLERPTYVLARWLFLRLLGGTYLVAFLSLGAQIPGLVGDGGILPASRYLETIERTLGPERFHRFPTLAWLDPDPSFLTMLWVGGATLSVLLVVGIAPRAALFLLWAFYLSLSTVCQNFLWFQWDTLLLETGFLAIFLAPGGLWPRLDRERVPSGVALWLLNWLLFRLMFASGVVKLASGDPTWWGLTALEAHYQTQPLPTWVGWYAHQLPEWFQRGSTVAMFGIELVIPFLIFMPRRPRIGAFCALVFLQICIALTGNYGFFNILTLGLCLLLLDDAFLSRILPAPLGRVARNPHPRTPAGKWLTVVTATGVIPLVLLSGVMLSRAFRHEWSWPAPVRSLVQWAAPFRSVNSYGLFARMTTRRPEIIVEGSHDGQTWLAYDFRWKPGNLHRRPGFVAPHMPRLDWQMWFAALGDSRRHPWFGNFVVRLLQGSPEVLDLLATNPFPDRPPRYVRALRFQYEFTSLATRDRDGVWWRRELKGTYLPPVTLPGP